MTGLTDFPRHSPALAQQYRDAGFWNDDRLADYLERWADETPDKVAIAAPDRDIAYAEWRARSRRFANALLGLGLRRGDVVAIQYPNHPEFPIAFLGVAMMGGVLCTLHMPYRAGEMAPLMNHGRARAVICTAADARYDAPATMAGLKAQVPSLEHIIVVGGDGSVGSIPGGLDFDALIDGADDRPIADPPAAADPVILCFTSGTSASPKGVVRTHENFTSNLRIYPQTIGLTAADRILVAPPFTHVFGLSCGMLGLCHGATNVLMSLFSPELYADRLIRGLPTVVFSAPAHVAATIKAGLLDDADLASIRDVIVAGSVCPPEVAAALERRMPNGRTGQLFGMTETILIMQTPLDASPEVRHTSTGRKTVGIDVRIADPETDKDVPTGTEGELQLQGLQRLSGLSEQSGCQYSGLRRRRLFPDRRSRHHRCRGQCRHHRPGQGCHQPRRHQDQPDRCREPAAGPSGDRARGGRADARRRAGRTHVPVRDAGPRREPDLRRDDGISGSATALRRCAGRSGWKSSMNCR